MVPRKVSPCRLFCDVGAALGFPAVARMAVTARFDFDAVQVTAHALIVEATARYTASDGLLSVRLFHCFLPFFDHTPASGCRRRFVSVRHDRSERTGAAAVGGIDEAALVTGILHDALDGCGIGADERNYTVDCHHISETDIH